MQISFTMPVPVETGGCYMKLQFPKQIPLAQQEYIYTGSGAFAGTDSSLAVLAVDRDVYIG